MKEYLDKIMGTICDSINRLDDQKLEQLVKDIVVTLENGKKVVMTGLGKNAPICKKAVGTMMSLGMESMFIQTNSAMHGDLGSIRNGDIVLVLSKSGETAESIYLLEELKRRDITIWVLTYNSESTLAKSVDKSLIIEMDDEGDLWNLVPNNSTTLYLIILQAVTIQAASRLGVTLEDFQKNHPGGGIGVKLNGN